MIRRIKVPSEVRRARGEIACAECYRHKLKCDRSIPCQSCIRKGCPEICPNGTLLPGQGPRYTRADREGRHQKLALMTLRMRQLEEALQTSHSLVSSERHPLLIDAEVECDRVEKEIDNADSDNSVKTRGTLAELGPNGESYVGTDLYPNFIRGQPIGQTNLVGSLIMDRVSFPETLHFIAKPKRQPAMAYNGVFPCCPAFLSEEDVQALIEEKLPSFERASELIEVYLENVSWMFRVVDREQIWEELMPEIYRKRGLGGGRDISDKPTDLHILSLLLAIFAVGATGDPALPHWSEEAELYNNLSRTAISLQSVFDEAGLVAVQAITVLAIYEIFTCRKTSMEGTWKITSFCMALATGIGLNRDPSRFDLPPRLVQRRRQVFWELYFIEAMKTCASGRPITFPRSSMDCELPEDKEASLSEDGTTIPSVWGIRYRFTKEVMADLAEKLCEARPLKYSEILSLDQRINDFGPKILASAIASAKPSSTENSSKTIPKKIMISLLRDVLVLMLHRNFFMRALTENPENPMKSRFGPSFLSTFRSAISTLRTIREDFDGCARFMRIWPVWVDLVSASVVLGSVAACGSTSALAPQAFVEFGLAIEMMSKVHVQPLISEVMPMLIRLQDRARQALEEHGNRMPFFRPAFFTRPPAREDGRESTAVGGGGRVIESQQQFESRLGPGTLPTAISNLFDFTYAQSEQPERPPGVGDHTTPLDTEYGAPRSRNTLATSNAREVCVSEDVMGNNSNYGRFRLEKKQAPGEAIASGSLPPHLQTSTSTHNHHFGSNALSGAPSSSTQQTVFPCSVLQEHLVLSRPNGREHQVNDTMDIRGYTDHQGVDVLPVASDDASLPTEPLVTDMPIDLNALFEMLPSSTTAFTSTNQSGTAADNHANIENDFDVDFNLRASTGDEFTGTGTGTVPFLQSTNTELEAWRSALQGSRFFGFHPADNEWGGNRDAS